MAERPNKEPEELASEGLGKSGLLVGWSWPLDPPGP